MSVSSVCEGYAWTTLLTTCQISTSWLSQGVGRRIACYSSEVRLGIVLSPFGVPAKSVYLILCDRMSYLAIAGRGLQPIPAMQSCANKKALSVGHFPKDASLTILIF